MPKKKTGGKAAGGNAVPVAPNTGEKTISVRKINNGWIIREEWVTPTGRYKNKETFTKTKPVFQIKS